jgi:hypothetical protein
MATWFFPLDPECPDANAFTNSLLGDPMTKAVGAPIGDIMVDFNRKHLGECVRCREYGAANIEINH